MSPEIAIFGFLVLDALCGSWSVTYYGDRIISFGMKPILLVSDKTSFFAFLLILIIFISMYIDVQEERHH